jgi:hypothetical protein
MSRLICLSFDSGQLIEIPPHRYVIAGRMLENSAKVILLPAGEGANRLEISSNELASWLVLEKATLIDDLDIPDDEPDGSASSNEDDAASSEASVGSKTGFRRPITDLSQMPISRILDWHRKIYTLKCIMQLGPTSYKSSKFCAALKDAETELAQWGNACGLFGGKKWSKLTLYHDLLRWRHKRYDLSQLQLKGVEYTPWVNRSSSFYVEVKNSVTEMGLEMPHLSAANIHKEINRSLRKKSKSLEEAAL